MATVMEQTKFTFEAPVLEINSWHIVKLPKDVSDQLPSRGQVMSNMTVNGQTAKTMLEPDGNWGHWFKVTDAMHAKVGDKLSVTFEPTKDWPDPEIPKDFQKALDAEPEIKAFFQTITPMAKWEWPRWIYSTSVEATQQKRIKVSIDKLRKGMRRPCCFNRNMCTQPAVSKTGILLDPTK